MALEASRDHLFLPMWHLAMLQAVTACGPTDCAHRVVLTAPSPEEEPPCPRLL